jgi:glycosyltransferase involved in cell wall biosynthesis
MKLALIADTFPPSRTSGAVQLRDLAREIVQQGHELTIILPDPEITGRYQTENFDGAVVLRLKTIAFKENAYVRRTLAELLLPLFMRANLDRSPLAKECWDGILWYSPSIFFGPLIQELKRRSGCKAYLIIRDIFPEWALELGILRRGPVYWFFRAVAARQYQAADIIGVQSRGNLAYFGARQYNTSHSLEVLANWLAPATVEPCSIDIGKTPIAGRKIAVYAGNMGIAQGMDIVIELAEAMIERPDVGFLLVGRGSEVGRLKERVATKGLDNVVFANEIAPDQIPALYSQCHIGLVVLDPRHKSHNIPGKFISYMQNGLSVLASVNAGNDLADMIRREKVGAVCEDNDVTSLAKAFTELLEQVLSDTGISARCSALFRRDFGAETAVRQIVNALSK